MSIGTPESGAEEFARRRVAWHDRTRRRTAVIFGVLVLVGAIMAGVLVAYAFGGDSEPERDQDGRLVPPDALVLDEESAQALVAQGTWPGDDRVEGMPAGDAARIGWLLSDIAWGQENLAPLGRGLAAATLDDPDLAVAMTEGVARASHGLVPGLREPVMSALANWQGAVAAVLAEDTPASGEPDFAQPDLLATFDLVGLDAAGPLEDPLVLRMSQGWERSLPVESRDAPGAPMRFVEDYEELFRQWVQPVVLLYAGLAREECAPDQGRECRRVLAARTARADGLVATRVLDSIPRELLPREVDRALGADAAPHRRLPPDAARVWERFRVEQGYGVLGPVLDALVS